MTDQSRVELLVLEWEQARKRRPQLTPEQVCAKDPHLLHAVRAILLKMYPHLDDTRPQVASDTDAKTTPKGQPEPLPLAVGEYRVVRELGRGGMGRVYEADDPHLRRRVAVKVMKPELFADPAARERFLREAHAQAAVQHDHVAVIHDVKQTDDGTPFLVMPLLRGETLADRLKRQYGRPLPIHEVLRIGRQIADGLAAAHAKGLVHRDVKPSNVWLDETMGQVRVLDFGLARWLDPDGSIQQGTPAGTLLYMPPEQLQGGTLDQRADLYSLGAVLFEMCTGRRAVSEGTPHEMITAVMNEVPPRAHSINPDVPARLSKAIADLLSKERTARAPDTAAGVAAVLGMIAESEDATVTLHPTSRPPARSPRWPLVGIATGVLLTAIPLTTWFVTRPPADANASTPAATATPPTHPAAAKPLTGWVDMLVYRRLTDGREAVVRLSNERAMPLRTGDEFRIVAEVSRPAYLYLFWIDETGTGVPVYPWRLGEWGTRPETEETKTSLDLQTPKGTAFRITGDISGMETILLLARPTPLTATDDEVKGWFVGLKPLPFTGDRDRAWFENFDLQEYDPTGTTRSIGGSDGPVRSSPRALLAALKQKIGPIELSRAVSFARLGANNTKNEGRQ